MDEDTAGHVNAQFADNQTDYVVSTMLSYVLRYNLGSMAFGSLILAIVETLVWVLEFIDEQTKASEDSNVIVRIVMRCCKCCMFCFERCLKFVSSYAYIFVFMQARLDGRRATSRDRPPPVGGALLSCAQHRVRGQSLARAAGADAVRSTCGRTPTFACRASAPGE